MLSSNAHASTSTVRPGAAGHLPNEETESPRLNTSSGHEGSTSDTAFIPSTSAPWDPSRFPSSSSQGLTTQSHTGENKIVVNIGTPGHLPPLQRPPQHVMKYYVKHAQELAKRIVRDYIPHPLSPQELQEYHRDTHDRLRKIHLLEEKQLQLAPHRHPQLEQTLFMERLEYRIRFPRTFRINDLPDEIVANIFRYIVWSAEEPGKGIGWRLWITWTCRHWRQVAIADPTLWNAIWFRDRPKYERSLAWLERSAGAPLDLRINDRKDLPFTAQTMIELLDKVFVKFSNIRMLIVVVEDWEPALVILDKIRCVAEKGVPTIMERFELHRSGSPYIQPGSGYMPNNYSQPLVLFGGADVPTLRYFSINGIYVDWEKSILKNLTTLDLRRIPLGCAPSVSRFRDILQSCPAIRKLILDGAGPNYQREEAAGLPPILLTQLKILVLANFSLAYARYIVPQISAPEVRDLTLMNFSGEDYSPLYLLLTGRFPQVRLLTMWNTVVPENDRATLTMIRWLDSMPRTSYLRIANVGQTFLNTFLIDPAKLLGVEQDGNSQRRAVCPQLTTLEIQAVDPVTIGLWGQQRKRIDAPLNKIYISRKMATTLNKAQFDILSSAGSLHILEIGGKAPEEDEAHRS